MTHEEILKLAHDVMDREEFPEYEGGNRLWARRYLALSAKLQEAEKLAYIGEHRFPDLTWKARCEEMQAERDQMAKDLAWYHKQRDELLPTASRGEVVKP